MTVYLDGMVHPELFYRISDTIRFALVMPSLFAAPDIAERASARSEFPEYHECCGLVTPAFETVGTRRLFTDRVQVQFFLNAADTRVVGSHRRFNLQPLWLSVFEIMKCSMHTGYTGANG
jgi:hypothetical protein